MYRQPNRNAKRRAIKPQKLKDYQITYDNIADWFGYSSARSFNSSTIKKQMLSGIEDVILHIEYQITKGK